jgi:riboflavin kinase/FMN adenylyltransferase
MQVEEELAKVSPKKDMLLTIGVFDGVHLGHKYLISKLTESARQQNLLGGVVTFRQHPQEVLPPQSRLPFLTSLTDRVSLLKNEGVENVIVLSFTRELARLSARQFVSLLKKYLRMKGLIIGPDFALGSNREGNTGTLSALGEEMGFSVNVVPPIVLNGEVISSTAIRNALSNGDMKRVHNLMGRLFSLHGDVVTGTGRGTELSFPTANLDVNSAQALPPEGVYATLAYINGKVHQSVTNIGKRPTFGENKRTVEVHIPGYHGDLYGQELKIDVVERLRSEIQFKSAEALKKQIAEDVEKSRAILSSKDRN